MPSKLKTYQNRKAELVKAQRELNDKADETGALADDDKATFGANAIELESLANAIAREEKLQDLEREMIPTGAGGDGAAEAAEVHQQEQANEVKWSFGEQLIAVQRAASLHPSQWDERLVPSAATGLSDAVGSEGGFLVGTDTSSEMIRRAFESTQVFGGNGYGGVTRIPISAASNSVKINAVSESSRATGSRWGGIQAYWIETGGAKTASKPDFRQITLSLKKLIGLCYSTDELLQDAAALEAIVREAFAAEFAFMLQDAVINGPGGGQPLGILNSSCLVSVAKETGQAAATIVKENIDKMYSRLWARSVANSVWFINQDCYPQLFSLTQSVGTGGVPVFLPPGGLSASPYGTLMGRPVIPIEQCQTLGTKGDICLCDLSEYLFADKGGVEVATSIHIKFDYDETAFRFVYRCDGQPSWDAALTPFKGTNTVSPFVALAARA